MTEPVGPPPDWRVRQVPWLSPGSVFVLSGTDLRDGRQFNAPFTIGAPLGKGGQAAVFALVGPTDTWRSGEVVLRTSYQDDEYGRDPRRAAIYRQLAELRAGEQDALEGLLRLHAVGQFDAPSYLPSTVLWAQLMDWAGVSLTQWLDREEAKGLGPARSAAVMLPVAQSLQVCHHAGLVHRDIKPNNVFAVDRAPAPVPSGLTGARARRLLAAGLPFVRLGDLGSMTHAGPNAHPLLDDEEPNDQTHTITSHIDTGPFTPPELFGTAAFGEADPAGDVWQLAVTWYYAATHDLPFDGWRAPQWRTDPRPYRSAISEGEPNSAHFSQLPDRMQYVLRWALSPDPRDRPAMADLVDELTRLGEPALVPVSAPELPTPAPVAPAPVLTPESASSAGDGGSVDDLEDVGDTDETHRHVDWGEPTTSTTSSPPSLPSLPSVKRTPLISGVAAASVGALLLGGYLIWPRGSETPTAANSSTAVPGTVAATVAEPVPRFTGETTWRTAPTLAGSLPQLFTGTPLAYLPVQGTLTEKTYGFCSDCVTGKVRLRADVTATSLVDDQSLTLSGPGPRPIGPYLVVVAKAGQQFTSTDPKRPDVVYPMVAQYTSANFGEVALIPANPQGEGGGLYRGDTSWQTKLADNGPSRLTFDMPGKSQVITIVWLTKDAVIGLNRFPSAKRTPEPTRS